MKRIEYKTTRWKQILLPNEVNIYEVYMNMQKFEDPLTVCYDDKLKSLPKNKFCELQNVEDSEVYMDPYNNLGNPTFRIYDDLGELKYVNAKNHISNINNVKSLTIDEVCKLLKKRKLLEDGIYEELKTIVESKQKREL